MAKALLHVLLILTVPLMGLTMPTASLALTFVQGPADMPPCHQQSPKLQTDAGERICPVACCQTLAKEWILLPAAKTHRFETVFTPPIFISQAIVPPTAPPRVVHPFIIA